MHHVGIMDRTKKEKRGQTTFSIYQARKCVWEGGCKLYNIYTRIMPLIEYTGITKLRLPLCSLGGHHNYEGDVNDAGERGLDGLTTKDRCNKKGSNEKGLGKAKVMEGHFSTSSYKEPLLKAFGHELKILCTKRSNKRHFSISSYKEPVLNTSKKRI